METKYKRKKLSLNNSNKLESQDKLDHLISSTHPEFSYASIIVISSSSLQV